VEYLTEELKNKDSQLKNKDTQLKNKDTQLEKLKKENDDLNRNYFKPSYFLLIYFYFYFVTGCDGFINEFV
jgi:hypothetical protein